MHRRHVLALWGALAAGALGGCIGAPRTDGGTTVRAAPGPEPTIEDDDLRALVHEANGFGFDLYRALLEDDPTGNVFSSPLSISIALAMTYAGAREETRGQMRDVLRYPIADTAVHEAFEALQAELDARGQDVEIDTAAYDEDDDPVPFELALANSVWGQEDYPFDAEYLTLLEEHYGGPLREVGFSIDPAGAREAINAWVADATEDRIDELLPEGSIDTYVRLVLVNAIYFLANWEHPFEEQLTSTETFTALDGRTHNVPMMTESRSWEYAEVDGAQAVDLPYVGEEASMLVILPPEGAFAEYEEKFDGETLGEIVDALERRDGAVNLPRFEFETSVQLKPILEAMGMTDAFDGRADFSGMVEGEEGELYIDEVYHDAFVSVDEEGTEAAAATAVVMRAVSAPFDPFSFEANRPFLFAIRDRRTETVLFLGRVVDPGSWENDNA